MTEKEKRELKDGVISIFKKFNILDHTATIGGLRDDILRYIDSLQEELVAPKVLEGMLNAKTAAESLGISQEEHDRIVDELIYGKEPEYLDDFLALEEIPPKFPLISQKKCMYTKDSYTDEDRKVLCDGCEEECKYAHREEPVSKDTMTIRKEWFEQCKKSWYNEGYIDGKHNRDGQFGEPVSEDLEEASKECINDLLPDTLQEGK